MEKWFEGRLTRRILSLALSVVMVLSLLPMPSIAAEGDGLCEHHTEHTGCGYVAAVEGQECTHVCGEDCYTVTTDCQHVHDESCYSDGALPAAGEEKAADACTHECTEESGCVTKVHTCVHTVHDGCGYVEAVAGSPCTYQCKLCAGEPDAPAGSQSEKTVISAWAWDDGFEIVDEESGYVVLPFTSEDFTSQLDDVKGMLPEAILVGEEALTLGNWTYETGEEGAVVTIDSESCPSPGSFKTTLPEGYVLADGTNVLSLTVALSAGSSEDTSSYADSDVLTNVSYYDANGTRKTCPSATIVTNTPDVEGGNTITWGKPGMTTWYAVNNSYLTIGNSDDKWTIYVKGDVHLIMMQGSWLCMYGQIEVLKGDSLTVYCDNTSNSGKLQVWGAINHAAIGGSVESPDSGKITINSGTVTVSTGNGGAGIGSGEGGSAGDITINGGDIDARAYNGGAAIGTGKNGKSATITINNCENIYCHANGGAGIGSGENSSGDDKVTVNIRGGKIDAHGRDGAGIGSGKNAPLSVDVNINGGDIYAQTGGMSAPASHGAAIGGGYGATNTTVKIGGTAEVGAKGGENAPGIGSIDPGGCSVTISGGTVNAEGGTFGAGIGGGSLKQTSCPVTITGGTVTAYGGDCAAGIGSGYGDDSKTTPYSTGTIIISGGTVTANGKYFAAGIGGGAYCTAGQIQIDGGTVIANRDASNDGDIFRAAFDIGDGATGSNMKKTYARYTLNGSAKLYLQHDYLVTEHTNITSGYIFKQFETKPEDYSVVQVFGAQTLSENFCIETGKTMTVMSGATLNTGSYNLYVKGTLTETGTASGNIYYPLTLVNCTASGNTSTYGDSNDLFGKADANISLKPALEGGYKFDSWTVTPNTVTVSNNSFPMPQKATTVEAKGTQVLQITQQPANKTITYGENVSLEIEASTSISGGVISYQWYKGTEKLPNETSKTLSLSRLGANTVPYTFYCEVTCDDVSINSDTVTVTVEKAKGSVEITGNPGKTYNGQPAELTTDGYSVTGDGKVTVEYVKKGGSDYSTTAPTNAGTYYVRVTMSESQNFEEASNFTEFTISKATNNEWQTEPYVTGFTYGDNVTNPVTYEAAYGNDDVVVTYKKKGTTDAPSNTVPTEAGTYDVTVTLEETNNYGPKLEATNLTLTIEKAASSVTAAPADAQSLYDGSPVSLVTAGTPAGGTMKYSLDGENWSKDIPTATEWGKYTVYYMVEGGNNHKDTTAETLTAEIVPFKIQRQTETVEIGYSNDAVMSVTLDTILDDQISCQWYQVTDEGDVALTGETAKELTIHKPNAGKYTYVCKITCGEYSKFSDDVLVTVNAGEIQVDTETNEGLLGYWLEGGEAPAADGQTTVPQRSPSSRLLTQYTTTTNDQGGLYPTGMKVFALNKDNQPEEIPALENLLNYEGCSIRIVGQPGIRMITSLTKEAKTALTQANLAGYTLEEYGTVVQWVDTLKENRQSLTLSTGEDNYAYRKGVSDPVFANVGNMTQYTNVLIWDSLTDEQYAAKIAMRPYIILSSENGETVTLYGGTVERSIYDVAKQNADTFPVGSAGYNYVHDIIDRVDKPNSSTNSSTGGNVE